MVKLMLFDVMMGGKFFLSFLSLFLLCLLTWMLVCVCRSHLKMVLLTEMS